MISAKDKWFKEFFEAPYGRCPRCNKGLQHHIDRKPYCNSCGWEATEPGYVEKPILYPDK